MRLKSIPIHISDDLKDIREREIIYHMPTLFKNLRNLENP